VAVDLEAVNARYAPAAAITMITTTTTATIPVEIDLLC